MTEGLKRQNKGIKDILDTENSQNGVFEIDEKFENGYTIFIPYGIHADLHGAIFDGIMRVQDTVSELRKMVNDVEQDVEMSNGFKSQLISMYNASIVKYEFDVKILTAFTELEADI